MHFSTLHFNFTHTRCQVSKLAKYFRSLFKIINESSILYCQYSLLLPCNNVKDYAYRMYHFILLFSSASHAQTDKIQNFKILNLRVTNIKFIMPHRR